MCLCVGQVVQIHPERGTLRPGESALCVLTFTSTDYPAAYQLDVICQVPQQYWSRFKAALSGMRVLVNLNPTFNEIIVLVWQLHFSFLQIIDCTHPLLSSHLVSSLLLSPLILLSSPLLSSPLLSSPGYSGSCTDSVS